MIVCPLSSGSKGNSCFIESNGIRILIDAGLSAKKTQERLDSISVDLATIDAVFVTHEHSDHIGGAGVIARKHKIPIYINEATYKATHKRIFTGSEQIHFLERSTELGELKLEAIPVSHDAAETVAYLISDEKHRCAIATDMGFATKLVQQKLKDCDLYLLEMNYDEKKLKVNPNYPWPLKQRIMSKVGHLSNSAGAELFNQLVTERTRQVFLAHLSEENNHAEIAFAAIEENCSSNPFYTKLRIEIAEQYKSSSRIELN